MRSSPRILAGLVSLASLVPAVCLAAEPALDRLVAPEAALVFGIEDIPGVRARFAESPLGRAWEDPEISRFVAPLLSNPDYAKLLEQVKAETGHSLEELLGFATGDLLLTVPVSSLKLAKAEFDADAILAIEVGENDVKIRELLAQQEAKQKSEGAHSETTEEYNGVTLHVVTPSGAGEGGSAEKPFVWAIHEGRWFLATDRALVTGALDALAAGGLSPSLSSSPAYRAVLDRGSAGRPDFAFLLDFQSIYPVVAAAFEASSDPAARPNAMGIEPSNIVKALGLDALKALSSTGSITGDGASVSDFALTYSEERGLVKLFAYQDGPVARPDWVPAAWINVSSQNFSVPQLYAELERILDRVSPMLAGMVLGQVRSFDRQLNIDLKRDFIGNLGPSILSGIALPASASAGNPPPYDEMEQFFAVSLADAAAFERTLETIKGRFLPPDGGPLEKREYLGRTLHVFTPPAGSAPDNKGFAYAIADGWLLVGVGSASTVEAAIQGMNKPDAAASFWARPDVRAALEAAPASAFSLQFADLRPLFASLAALAVKAQEAQGPDAKPFVDPAAVPSLATFAKYLSYAVTHGERRDDGFYFRTSTPPASANP